MYDGMPHSVLKFDGHVNSRVCSVLHVGGKILSLVEVKLNGVSIEYHHIQNIAIFLLQSFQ